MEAVDLERQQLRRLGLQRLGLSADVQRSFLTQVEDAATIGRMLMLPVQNGDFVVMQDPASGAPYFFPGLSPLGGSMPLAPGT